MKFKDKFIISDEFEELFSFNSKEEEIEHEAKMLMFRFLSEFEKFTDGKFKKKEIAEKIDISPSYYTQLSRGDKLINLHTLAKIQEAFNLQFQVKVVPVFNSYEKEVEHVKNAKIIPFYSKSRIFRHFNREDTNKIIIPNRLNEIEERKIV